MSCNDGCYAVDNDSESYSLYGCKEKARNGEVEGHCNYLQLYQSEGARAAIWTFKGPDSCCCVVVVLLSSSWGSCFVVQITIRKPRPPRHLCKIPNFGYYSRTSHGREKHSSSLGECLLSSQARKQSQWWVVADQAWNCHHPGCLISTLQTWPLAGWILASNGDIGVCWVGAGQQLRHGHVLGGCLAAIKTWVCVGWVLGSNQDVGVRWVGVEQPSGHGCPRTR